MIRINLLGEKADYSSTALFEVMGFAVAVMLALGSCVYWHMSVSEAVELADRERKSLEVELDKLKRITKKVEGLEKKKKHLGEKLSTIALLKARKHGPVRVLDDLNEAIPERAWLLAVKEKSGQLEISGIALDNQTIAMFMNSLNKASHFGNVDLVHSTHYVLDGVKLKEFVLLAETKDPLKVQRDDGASNEMDVEGDERKRT